MDEDSVIALNTLAWLLATHPDPRIQNGEEAFRLARQARELSNGEDPAILLSLAATQAEAGRYNEAIKVLDEAQQLAGAARQIDLFTRAESMRAQFEQHQPWRDENSIWK